MDLHIHVHIPELFISAILKLGNNIMSELDDLKASVSKLEADLTNNTTVLELVRSDLAAALANPTGVDPAAIEAIAQQINTDAVGLETEDAEQPTPPAPNPVAASTVTITPQP